MVLASTLSIEACPSLPAEQTVDIHAEKFFALAVGFAATMRF